MGTKNDPFLLSPLKKSAGKEQSAYLEIFVDQGIANYEKYMDYLASEKAHEMRLNKVPPKKKNKSDV